MRAAGAGERDASRADKTAAIASLWARAEGQVPRWESIMLRLPARPGGPVTAFIREPATPGPGPIPRSVLTLDAATAEVVRWEPYASANLGRKLRTWFRYLHTGEALGIVGQLVAGLASAGGVLLVWTGLSLCWRRFRAWTRRRASVPHPAAPPRPTQATSLPTRR